MSFISNPLPSIAGKAGKFLTNNGVTELWAAAPGNAKSDLIKYDANVTFGATLGALIAVKSIALTATTELVIVQATNLLVCAVWNDATKTFGTPATIRSGASFNFVASSVSSSSVLVCSLTNSTTALETVVLTITNTTDITVNTAVPTTLSANCQFFDAVNSMTKVGSSFVISCLLNTALTAKIIAITVSGAVPTLGTEYIVTTTSSGHAQIAYDSTTLLSLDANATGLNLAALPLTISGTTITPGTVANKATTAASSNNQLVTFSSGRVGVVFSKFVGTNVSGGVISISAGVATFNAVDLGISIFGSPNVQVLGNQAFIYNNSKVNILTDNAGAAVAGTSVSISGVSNAGITGFDGTSKIYIGATSVSVSLNYATVSISGNDPVINVFYPAPLISDATAFKNVASNIAYSTTLPNIENAAILQNSGKCAPIYTGAGFLCVSLDGASAPQPQQCVGLAMSLASGARSALNNYSGWLCNYTTLLGSNIYFRRVELTV